MSSSVKAGVLWPETGSVATLRVSARIPDRAPIEMRALEVMIPFLRRAVRIACPSQPRRGIAQADGEQARHREQERRQVGRVRAGVALVVLEGEFQQAAGCDRPHLGRAWTAVEERELADHRARG